MASSTGGQVATEGSASSQGLVELEERIAGAFLIDLIDTRAKVIAREEVASLCGLVLRRLQDKGSPGGGVWARDLESIFGEALRDFSSDTGEPGK